MNANLNPAARAEDNGDTICLTLEPEVANLAAIQNATALRADQSLATPRELVCGLIHSATKVVLAGSSKVGKTWILLFLALCAAIGAKFLNCRTCPCRVLYINLEIQSVFMKARLDALMKHMGITAADNLDVWNLRGFSGDADALWAEILRAVVGKRYDLIIIDPIYKLMVGKSENSSVGVGVLCNKLEQLAERSGAAIVIAHHFAKGNSRKKAALDRLSGSGVFARDADSIITLTEHTEENCFTLETTLRNFSRQNPLVVQWDYPVMVVREDLDPEDIEAEDAPTETDEGLMALLKEKPLTSGEWQQASEELGKSRPTFYRIKAVLKEKGFVEFDAKTKTWSVAGVKEVAVGETTETTETSETSENGKQA